VILFRIQRHFYTKTKQKGFFLCDELFLFNEERIDKTPLNSMNYSLSAARIGVV
jgi:hypothetical protein